MDNQMPNNRPAPTDAQDILQSLAFVGIEELGKDSYRGGVLVTDARGKPLEFRCTSAIQPTGVQKTLYGGTLRGHMCVELTARPLLAAIKEKPQVIFVAQEEFFELRTTVAVPLLLVAKQGSSIATKLNVDKPTKSELLASPAGKFEPVVITCHWQYPDDIRTVLPDLGSLFSRFDLVEPFERIKNALTLLHEKGAVPNK